MVCQKVCKQGRDDIIVKVNIQSPIPASFYITVTNWCKNDAGIRLCIFTFTIISSPCLPANVSEVHIAEYLSILLRTRSH